LASAQSVFTSAQQTRDAAQAALNNVVENARVEFNAMFAGSAQPSALDLQNYLTQISNAQQALATAQANFVTAEQALIPVQQAFDTLVANAKAEFSAIFSS
jgi:F0F1-type ATP synthase membrane subunit b/b'